MTVSVDRALLTPWLGVLVDNFTASEYERTDELSTQPRSSRLPRERGHQVSAWDDADPHALGLASVEALVRPVPRHPRRPVSMLPLRDGTCGSGGMTGLLGEYRPWPAPALPLAGGTVAGHVGAVQEDDLFDAHPHHALADSGLADSLL